MAADGIQHLGFGYYICGVGRHYPHIIKGRIIKERRSMSEEHRSEGGRLISTEYRDTISNRMIFNLLTPNGFRSLA